LNQTEEVEPAGQKKKTKILPEEEKKEEELKPKYSTDSETCWYENNTQLIYVIKT